MATSMLKFAFSCKFSNFWSQRIVWNVFRNFKGTTWAPACKTSSFTCMGPCMDPFVILCFLILFRWQLLKIQLSLRRTIHCMQLSIDVQEVSNLSFYLRYRFHVAVCLFRVIRKIWYGKRFYLHVPTSCVLFFNC